MIFIDEDKEYKNKNGEFSSAKILLHKVYGITNKNNIKIKFNLSSKEIKK